MMLNKIMVWVLCIVFLGCQKQSENLNSSDPIEIPKETLADIPVGDPLNSTEIGNGGDLIQCRPHPPKFPYPYQQGWYTLDYAGVLEARDVRYLSKPSLKAYIKHLYSLIERGAPDLIQPFEEYLISVPFLSENDQVFDNLFEIERVWIEKEKNEEIFDENIDFLPRPCVQSPRRQAELHQVVVRQEYVDSNNTVKRIEYSYDPDLIAKIGDKDLQMSMLIFHEWLWDLYPAGEARRLRRANRQFHQASELTERQVKSLLNQEVGRRDRNH